MDTKDLKKNFSALAEKNGFKAMRHGWLKESPECIVTLDLQKNPFGKLYHLNIKIFIQGKFGNYYSSSDEKLIREGIGYLLSRSSQECKIAFDLTTTLNDADRKQKLESCFDNFIAPFVKKALTRKGLIELADSGQFFMVDETKQELARLEAII